jgi:hypothetical protein
MNEVVQLLEHMPKRRSTHAGRWVPIYLEPLAGSGERICIAVAAADDSSFVVTPVANLERFSCVYGTAAAGLAWSADLIVSEAEHLISSSGLNGLNELAQRIEGLALGPERRGAGTGLADLARLALQQVSALSAVNFVLAPAVAAVAERAEGGGWLESKIRQLVVGRQPELHDRFRKQFRRSQSSRPLRYGFIGKFIVANFATLQSKSSGHVSAQVDRAKARLWDLHQLDAGVLADSLTLRAPSMAYELLVHRPIVFETGVEGALKSALKAAEEELEAEADKFDIRFRPLRSVDAIADYLIEREAA